MYCIPSYSPFHPIGIDNDDGNRVNDAMPGLKLQTRPEPLAQRQSGLFRLPTEIFADLIDDTDMLDMLGKGDAISMNLF